MKGDSLINGKKSDTIFIDIYEIVKFYNQLSFSPQEIRESINDLSWENQMRIVINSVL